MEIVVICDGRSCNQQFKMDKKLIYEVNFRYEILNVKELIFMKIILVKWKQKYRKWFNCVVQKIDKGIKSV